MVLGGTAARPCRALLAVSNVAAHLSAASVPIAVLLYNGPLLCGFNVPIKGSISKTLLSLCMHDVACARRWLKSGVCSLCQRSCCSEMERRSARSIIFACHKVGASIKSQSLYMYRLNIRRGGIMVL